MPTVGKRHYSYTPDGEMAAAAEAKRTGKRMKTMKSKAKKKGKKPMMPWGS